MKKRPSASILDRLLARLRGGVRSRSAAGEPAVARPYSAISIYRGVQACAIARKFSDHRFLSRDAPQLPLSGCTMSASCDCRYVRHQDRRGDMRRLPDFGLSHARFTGRDRRATSGRRKRD